MKFAKGLVHGFGQKFAFFYPVFLLFFFFFYQTGPKKSFMML